MSQSKPQKPILSKLDAFKRVKRSGNYRRQIKKCANELLSIENTQTSTNLLCSVDLPSFDTDADADINPNEPSENWLDSYSDSEECGNDELKDFSRIQTSFIEGLTQWAIQCQPSRHQVCELLTMCNQTLSFRVPVDPRTILHRPRSIVVKQFPDGGLYWHRGLKESLHLKLQGVKYIPQKISLNINVDGLPIAKASNAQFWPILFNIHELYFLEPAVIGIYCGLGMIFLKLKRIRC